MKKLLAVLLCIVMSLSMLGVMVACEGDKESDGKTVSASDDKSATASKSEDDTAGKSDEELIIGQWEADINFNEQLLAAINGGDGDEMDEMMEYFDLSGLTLKLGMEFKNDGTAAMTFSDADAQAFVEKYIEIMRDGTVAYMKAVAEENGMTWEDYLASAGMTEQEFADLFTQELDTDELKKGFMDEITDSVGYYKIENGKLYMADSKDFEDEDGVEYKLTAKTLTFEKDGIKLTFNKK